ncbi:MAG: helix-turn-helix domain-containing protein [Nitrospira sp. SB0677_bin_15]|nr:helix-turn-helix domain-containing protein [Nitrospira sp. SB0677_bin_15]MYH01435.1 helix-turn-helix domain-containing protein [Nitrospira sp. SB0675_bin_23]
MASLGNKLQTAREAKGFTLGQIASKTRISESHLRALEADSLDQLPERVFTKGFVRAYARSLELDEEECLRLFEEGSASFYQKEKEGKETRKRFLGRQGIQKERTSRVMVVLLVGGPLLLGGIVLFQQQSPSGSIFSRFPQQPVEPRDEVVSKPGRANEVVEDHRSSAVVSQDGASSVKNEGPATEIDAEIPLEAPVDDGASTPSALSPDSAPAPTTDSEDVVLEIRTLDVTWAVIRSDEDTPQEFLLRAGEVIRRRARDRFLLTLGNAGGVEVRLNGQLQGPFGEPGTVVRDVELRPSRSPEILDRENPH